MAMNKKEQAEMAELKKQLSIVRALNWTQPVIKDVPRPDSGTTHGYNFNTHNCLVYEVWSQPVRHGTGRAPTPHGSASQNGIAMYSTKILALRGLRYAVELECAKKLAAIDAQIEAEESF